MLRSLFTSGEDTVPVVQEAGWAPGPVWTGAETLAPIGIRSPDRPVRSQSQYRLRYLAHLKELNPKLMNLSSMPIQRYVHLKPQYTTVRRKQARYRTVCTKFIWHFTWSYRRTNGCRNFMSYGECNYWSLYEILHWNLTGERLMALNYNINVGYMEQS
jgi:hypothetical protein